MVNFNKLFRDDTDPRIRKLFIKFLIKNGMYEKYVGTIDFKKLEDIGGVHPCALLYVLKISSVCNHKIFNWHKSINFPRLNLEWMSLIEERNGKWVIKKPKKENPTTMNIPIAQFMATHGILDRATYNETNHTIDLVFIDIHNGYTHRTVSIPVSHCIDVVNLTGGFGADNIFSSIPVNQNAH